MKYVVVGGGISGLSIARILQNNSQEVIVLEADSRPGGMIKCDRIGNSLFHRMGGHVFNTKRKDVLSLFWQLFDSGKEFVKAYRNSCVFMGEKTIPYPIEDHVYMLNDELQKKIISDLLNIVKCGESSCNNFESFLKGRFGKTLYDIYFQPYNYKVWRKELDTIPLSWLEGKLPMPTVQEMIYNNINHIEERKFVHSSFFYPQKGGSQFIADRFAEGLNIKYNTKVEKISYKEGKWNINGIESDRVIFCGNIKQFPMMIESQPLLDIDGFIQDINELKYHGTTAVFCKIQKNPYSWIYLPNRDYESHRIICTGNFSESNNKEGEMTATVEFTDEISLNDILNNLKRVPHSPQYITHNYEKCTYPIQSAKTRRLIESLKHKTECLGLYFLGRFAEWEYYNMDIAIGAALDLYDNKLK